MTQKTPVRIIVFRNLLQVETACKVANNMPLDGTMQAAFGPYHDPSTEDQRKAMFAGVLKDISEQVFLDGKWFSKDAWHELCKEAFLPEEDDPDLPEMVKDPANYRKWAFSLTTDRRVLVGSTKDLTRKGMATYMRQIEAYGATEHGVHFHLPPSYEK